MNGRKMTPSVVPVTLVILTCAYAQVTACYWNEECPYLLYSSKTPYDTVRGDIRDYDIPNDCVAVSIWSLIRHGNRNPNGRVTESMKYIASLKDEIIASYDTGRSELCAQDIQNLRKWTWNETLETEPYVLTETGYQELFDIGSRLREKYPHLLQGTPSDYYFRPTNEQRTVVSARAFVHGLTEGTKLSLTPDHATVKDEVIMHYQHCARYQKTVRTSHMLRDQMRLYYNTEEYNNVRRAVQQRLGIHTQLKAEDIYAIYEICRFERSWAKVFQSPWCAALSRYDLEVLEYKDDARHYYWNSYGYSSINEKLGGLPLKDLYENFEASINGQGKKIVSYFSHDTMVQMVFCAMGIFKDAEMQMSSRDPDRLWRTSYISPFSANIIAVLNRCKESDSESYRVQIFINEKETELCPIEGCTWQEFRSKFESFKSLDLKDSNFCDLDYTVTETETRRLRNLWIMLLALLKLWI